MRAGWKQNRTQWNVDLWISNRGCGWKRFLAFGGEETKWWGQRAKRPGAERVSTCPGLSSVAPLNRPLKNRPPGKTTPPSINHSNYKAEKRRGGGGVKDRKMDIGLQTYIKSTQVGTTWKNQCLSATWMSTDWMLLRKEGDSISVCMCRKTFSELLKVVHSVANFHVQQTGQRRYNWKPKGWQAISLLRMSRQPLFDVTPTGERLVWVRQAVLMD